MRAVAAALFVLLASIAGHTQTPPAAPVDAPSVPDEILVRFGRGMDATAVNDRVVQLGARVVKSLDAVEGLYLIKLPAGLDLPQARATFARVAGVLYAEPNYLLYSTATPNDPQYTNQWGLHNTGQSAGTPGADIHAPEAWDITTGSSSVVVAVIDTGIDYNHPDLAANMFRNEADCNANGVDDDGNGYIDDCYGIDTANDDSDPLDDHNHGTHVSGTIGAVGNNGVGVAGVNWNVKLMGCKFLDAAGTGVTSNAIDCLTYIGVMKDRGVNIVATNNSWGGDVYSQALYDAIDAQRQRGILFIAAAGNAGSDNDTAGSYPSNYDLPNVIAVAATTRTDARASFSNYGRRTVHIGAPGSEIVSTVRSTVGTGYGTLSGTSMATPHVTGVAALLKAQDSNRDWRAIKNLILAGADAIASLANATVTGRRLNARGSMTCADVTVESRLRPTMSTVAGIGGQPITLRALHINCANPSGDVTITVSGGQPPITLKDDGVSPDQAADDGVYSGSFTPISGAYTLTFPGNDTVTVDVANAAYDSSSMAPRCTAGSSYCSSGTLLNSRDSLSSGAELHQPNTINASCADGMLGSYLSDESIESIRVSTVDGSVIAPGKTVRVDVTVYAFVSNDDHLDIYTSPSATSPTWSWLTTLTPASPGLQTLSATFVVASGGSQAIRANFRFLGAQGSCSRGAFDDHDDLIYMARAPFTDDLLSAGSFIKAVHITELRTRINAVRAARGLAAFPFTDPTLTAGSTTIKAVHITELRTALAEAYAAAGLPAPTYTDPGLAAAYLVRALHISELRDAVAGLE